MIIKVACGITRKMSSSASMKPPNIGIFQRTSDVNDVYTFARTQLSKCLNIDRYAFVRIDESAVRRRDKWADNVRLVVICGRKTGIDEDILREFRDHVIQGGKLLDVSTSLDVVVDILNLPCRRTTTPSASVNVSDGDCPTHLMNQTLLCIRKPMAIPGVQSLVSTDDGIIVVGTILGSPPSPPMRSVGKILFSQIRLEVDTPSALTFWQTLLTRHFQLDCSRSATTASLNLVTPCHLFSSSEMRNASFLKSIGPHLLEETEIQGSRLTLTEQDDVKTEVIPADDRIPLLMHTSSSALEFDREAYFRHLTSVQLGHVVIFGRIVPSTMDLISSFVAPHGTVIIAGRQTNGRGRSNHCWLSPEGCAMFSVHVRLSLNSAIGQRPSFVQHLAAMAAVQGILTLPGYEKLDVKLKWPNDIYYGNSTKIGGVFVQSSIMHDELRYVIGVGLNLSNGHPTKCINDIIRAYRRESLPELTPEVSIARTLSRLEKLFGTFEADGDGVKTILLQYYDLWIHQNAKVKLSLMADTPQVQHKDAVIQGLDDDGFLVVKLTDDGSLYSVQPDGNSFDVLHNMVVVRRQTSTFFHGPLTS